MSKLNNAGYLVFGLEKRKWYIVRQHYKYKTKGTIFVGTIVVPENMVGKRAMVKVEFL